MTTVGGVGPVFLGQGAQCLTGQRDGRLVPEVLGLGARQGIEVSGLFEGETGGVDRRGQCCFRQFFTLLSHPEIIATSAAPTALAGTPTTASSGVWTSTA